MEKQPKDEMSFPFQPIAILFLSWSSLIAKCELTIEFCHISTYPTFYCYTVLL